MESNIPMVSVVIPCRNEKSEIATCVETMLTQKPPPGDYEIIIADGMSDDGTREILARLAKQKSRVRVIDNPDRFVSPGLNAAIRAARGRIIIRIDCHTEYASDYLYQCVTVLNESGADNVGGPWVAKGAGLIAREIAAAFQSRFSGGGTYSRDPGYEGPVDTVYLGCWKREIFDQVGFFDEELVRNQDDEFNLRLRRAGRIIWQSPRIKSWYKSREFLGALFRQYMQYGYWKVRVMQKHNVHVSIRHIVPGAFVFFVAILPPLSLWSPGLAWGWLALISAYVTSNLTASALVAGKRGWKMFGVLPVVFGCFHVGYGCGFLRGILDFVIINRIPAKAYVTITRPSVTNSPQK